MRPRDYILAQIDHQETHPVPFTIYWEDPVGEMLDDHFGDASWRDEIPRYLSQVAGVDTCPLEDLGADVKRDVFGSVKRFDRLPFHVVDYPLKTPSLEGYEFPRADQLIKQDRLDESRATLEASPNRFKIAGFGELYFERMWQLRGFENALVDMIAEAAFVEEMMDRITELNVAFMGANARLPVDAVMTGDDWGDQRGVNVGPERWRQLFKPRIAKVWEVAHRHGKKVIHHTCGNVSEIIPDLIEIGLDVLESAQPEAMDIYRLKNEYGRDIAFWGGLGSQSIIPFGTPAEIRAEVKKLCSEMGRGGGFVLSPAKPLRPETPLENALAVIDSFMNQHG